MDYQEIAAELEVSPEYARVMVHQARKKLKEALQD
jgi:DNA-directed RNA polymerase specialized sigma24 family protein